MLATISKGQQITIPAIIRESLGLGVGSKVEIVQIGKKIVIKPLGEELEALFAETKHMKPRQKLTAEQMDELNERMFR
ncbi:MAG: AbrB/MazE/SpoVT family DNA-binding domain-containing protein [Nanoarchaeota archaeon]